MSLAELQAGFRRWLELEDEAAASCIGVHDARGLPVYLNNYRAQLMGCLETSYPLTLSWLGEVHFRAAAARHIERNPPRSWTLDDYAEGFAASLAAELPDHPQAAELAALEWALAQAFIAHDAPALAVGHLASTDWEQAQLRLVPSARKVALRTNAPEIRSALAREENAPAAAVADDLRIFVIWRQDMTCCLRPLTQDEASLFERLEQGLRFAALCEELVGALGTDAGLARAGGLLAQWASDGLLRLPAPIL